MDLVPYGDLHRDIKAVRGTARYEILSGHMDGTGLPAATVGDGGCKDHGRGQWWHVSRACGDTRAQGCR